VKTGHLSNQPCCNLATLSPLPDLSTVWQAT